MAIVKSALAHYCCFLALCLLTLNAFTQQAPNLQEWGEKFNTAGAALTFKETARTRVNGRTVVTYNLFASGLPQDGKYILWMSNLGSNPRAAADAFLSKDGEVVNTLADPVRHVAQDPINLKLFGGRGESFMFALISDDGQLRAFTQIVPFPIEVNNGPCRLRAIETGPYYSGVFISISGLQPNEELLIRSESGNDNGQSKAKATNEGTYYSILLPFVKGNRSGKARFNVTSKSCKVGIDFPWGEGSYQPQ